MIIFRPFHYIGIVPAWWMWTHDTAYSSKHAAWQQNSYILTYKRKFIRKIHWFTAAADVQSLSAFECTHIKKIWLAIVHDVHTQQTHPSGTAYSTPVPDGAGRQNCHVDTRYKYSYREIIGRDVRILKFWIRIRTVCQCTAKCQCCELANNQISTVKSAL